MTFNQWLIWAFPLYILLIHPDIVSVNSVQTNWTLWKTYRKIFPPHRQALNNHYKENYIWHWDDIE